MLIDPQKEELIPIKAVCGMFPGRSGKGISLSTVWRWIVRGQRGHKLASLVAGGQRYSSQEAVMRFLAELNAETMYQGQPTASQQFAQARVEEELEAAGL
jgi:hypothetical protein